MRPPRALPVLVAVVLAAGAVPASAYPRPGRTERVVVSADGVPPGFWPSQRPAVTPDGRFVAFESQSPELVPGDMNDSHDVFVRDRMQGTIERVSVRTDGTEGDATYWSSAPVISADGRYVGFTSTAGLVPDLPERDAHAYVHDRETGTTTLISVSKEGVPGDEWSYVEGITPDGRYVAISSWASNLVPDDTNRCSLGANVLSCPDVFVHDRHTGVNERVSVSTGGTEGNGWSSLASISDDGRFVAFQSDSTNLDGVDTNLERDIFVHDRQTGTTERVSVSSHGEEGNAQSVGARISGDGRFVTFESGASNLVPRDTNGIQIFVGTPIPPTDIFVHDREAGTTERIVAPTGAEPNDWSIQPAISADGRYVVFHSMATNLVPGDTNETMDTFVHDRLTGSIDRVSVSSSGEEGNHWSAWGPAAMTAGAREVIFATDAWNLVPGTAEGDREIVARDRGPDVGVGGIELRGDGDSTVVSGWATFSGRPISLASDPAGDATPGAAETGGDITGARVVARPETEDLLVQIDLTAIPGVRPASVGAVGGSATGWAGLPAVLYGFEVAVGGTTFEARVLRSSENEVPGAPTFRLYRCEAGACVPDGSLQGGYGNTGDQILVALPLDRIGAVAGSPLAFRAYTALGEAGSGELSPLDEVQLPAAALPAPSVRLGVAPAGTPAEEVDFSSEASLADGIFTGTIPRGDEVWARACLGETCGTARRGVGG